MRYLTDIPTALGRWYHCPKPSGILAFNAWKQTAFPTSVLFREVAQRYGIQIPNPNELVGEEDKCYKLLQEAGFQDIVVQSEQLGWYF
jgi:ubiquinone/menaquinone biosynthesis C-methylase UbiE